MSMFILSIAFIALSEQVALGQFPLKVCAPKSDCSCETIDGLIDLHPLATNDGTPRFRDIADSDGKTFYSWNPCYGFDEVSCNNVAMCQIKDHGGRCVSLGPQSSLMYVAINLYGLEFRYTHWGGANNSGHVIMTCDHNEEGLVIRRPDADFGINNFYLELKSKYACPVKTNVTTTPHSTSRTTTRQRPTTLAFIGTAKTPPTTTKPIFDINTLSVLMIGVMSLLLLLLLIVMVALFCYMFSRLNGLNARGTVNQGYGSHLSVNPNEKQLLYP